MMETNAIYCGDCLEILMRFPDESVDLIYLDPPFFSNKQYEVIWGDGAEIRAFGDRWKGGIHHYIGWMRERLEQCRRILKKTGSIYVHCDWHAGHYLKVMMDEVFGYNSFRNEIVWHYRKWTAAKTVFNRESDRLLFYTKTDKYTFNVTYRERTESTKKRFGNKKIDSGTYDNSGKRIPSKTLEIESAGSALGDVWDIPIIAPSAKERLGYPTQKPLVLLERIITASSNKGDIVLDPFGGCGTTVAAAQKLGRRWIGIDVSPTACKLMARRLREIGVSPKLIIGHMSADELKKYPHFEFQNWACEKLGGRVSQKKSSDMGIDGWTLDTTPIQVKQSEDVGRNPIDNFETAVQRAKRKRGIFVAFSFGKGAYEEAARAKEQGIEIRLVTVGELLEGGSGRGVR